MGAKIPSSVYNSSGVKGQSRLPDSGYFSAKIAKIEKGTTRPTTWVVTLMFETGFDTKTWLDLPFDEHGDLLPGFVEVGADGNASFISDAAERQYNAMLSEVKSVFVSAGGSRESETDLDIEGLVGKTVYIEWHSGRDLGKKYGKVAGYITKTRFESLQAAGTKPTVAKAAEASAEAAEGASVAPKVSVSKATVSAPSNGAKTVATPRVPRPSVAARGILPEARG